MLSHSIAFQTSRYNTKTGSMSVFARSRKKIKIKMTYYSPMRDIFNTIQAHIFMPNMAVVNFFKPENSRKTNFCEKAETLCCSRPRTTNIYKTIKINLFSLTFIKQHQNLILIKHREKVHRLSRTTDRHSINRNLTKNTFFYWNTQ